MIKLTKLPRKYIVKWDAASIRELSVERSCDVTFAHENPRETRLERRSETFLLLSWSGRGEGPRIATPLRWPVGANTM